jgi:hypothetical protein
MFALLPLAVIQQAPVMPPLIERCYTDLRSLDRILPFQYSDARRRKVTVFLEGWQTRLNRLDPGSLGLQDQVDLTLMKNDLNRELFQLDQTAKHWSEIAPVIPFAGQILELETERRRIEEIDPKAAAEKLTALTDTINKAKTTAKEAGLDEAAGTKAAGALRSLQRTLKGWFDHYDSYHPLFSWWCRRPYQDADKALVEYSSWVQKNLAASQDPEAITGDPIGREALLKALELRCERPQMRWATAMTGRRRWRL